MRERPLNKTLIVLRHAHRDTSKGTTQNNGLSEKGRRQVRYLFDFFFERFPDFERPKLISSPKKRCLETLEPLARKLERKLNLEPLLEERRDTETLAQFKKRIRLFKRDWIQSKDPLTILCSHGDWIPLFLAEAIGAEIHLKKGGWAELELNEKPELTWLIQHF